MRALVDASGQTGSIGKHDRARKLRQKPTVVWMTGISAAGKSTIANLLERELCSRGHHTYLLDGDRVRGGLNSDLGYTETDRVENIRRVTEVARLMIDAGLIVIVAFISPFREQRKAARALFEPGEFVEVFVDAPLQVAERRDPKGLYKQARRGEIPNFTAIDSPYEPPDDPELRIDTVACSPNDATQAVLSLLERLDRVRPSASYTE
jgi:bifunctional enzyme CysN/CysC